MRIRTKQWVLLLVSLTLARLVVSKEVSEMHTFTNELAREKSPYLLQHAHNPVQWYPWGEAAFEKAKREDKPIFLSIGYATCHWCHVMEHESFEDEEIAAILNDAFVCIKVDREERPDIDSIYMTVCQMMTGSGGWPLTIVMTPEKQPFYAATYIPPKGRFGRSGLTELVPRIVDAWKNRRAEVLETAGEITTALAADNARGTGGALREGLVATGYEQLMQQYDAKQGGFGGAPKFPTPHRLSFLLRTENADAVAAVEHTLAEMRQGGIYDQVGFGFHRYATDAEWLVPHFEKMLYDQALLLMAYTEAFELTQNPFYEKVAREIITYVLRDMTDQKGGFYSAEDADSEGEEGLFYIWSTSELKAALTDEEYEWLAPRWNISEAGNYLDEATRKKTGKNIPHLSSVLNEADQQKLEVPRKKLFDLREKRVHPLKDTKVLADWNGLMIAALAKAGRAFGEASYVAAAEKVNRFVEAEMRHDGSKLWHRWREGETLVDGHLDDYAFMILALIELYESTLDATYLETALSYNAVLEASFVDAENGGYFMTASDAEALIVRPKSLYDGAIPSGNSVQMLNLLKLARLTGRSELEQRADETAKAFSGSIDRSPSNFSQALMGLQFAEDETVEIVLVGAKDSPDTQALRAYIDGLYKPGKVLLFKDPAQADQLAKLAPFAEGYTMVDDKATVYVCRNFVCEKPVNSVEALTLILK